MGRKAKSYPAPHQSFTPHNKAGGTEQKSPARICKYLAAEIGAAEITSTGPISGSALQDATAPDLHFGLAYVASRAQTDAVDAVVLTPDLDLRR